MTRKTARKRHKPSPPNTAARRRAGKPAAGHKPADPVAALAEASATALGLSIDPAWRTGVVRNLHLILAHAAVVERTPLPDDIEQAPVFRA